MFLQETVPGYQVAAYGLEQHARVMPAHIEKLVREGMVCAECRQRITATVGRVVRGASVFHPSCAQRVSTRVDVPVVPRVIAQIGGAVPVFDRGGCNVLLPDGRSYEHERFAPDAFDESIAAGGQALKVNHGATLAGAFRTLRNDGGALCFSFALRDGALERRMLETITRGELRGLSFAFSEQQQRQERLGVVHVRARLKEISLLTETRRPAWFGSRCWVEKEW